MAGWTSQSTWMGIIAPSFRGFDGVARSGRPMDAGHANAMQQSIKTKDTKRPAPLGWDGCAGTFRWDGARTNDAWSLEQF